MYSCAYLDTAVYSYVQHVSNIRLMTHNEIEVVSIINSLNNSSPGWDSIPAKLAKRVLNYYIKPLTFLINQSFHDGIVPDELKNSS